MEVVATRAVCYLGKWYKAGETFECNPKDYAGLEAAGVEKAENAKPKKENKAAKDLKTR